MKTTWTEHNFWISVCMQQTYLFFTFPIFKELYIKKRPPWLFKLYQALFICKKLAADYDACLCWGWSKCWCFCNSTHFSQNIMMGVVLILFLYFLYFPFLSIHNGFCLSRMTWSLFYNVERFKRFRIYQFSIQNKV